MKYDAFAIWTLVAVAVGIIFSLSLFKMIDLQEQNNRLRAQMLQCAPVDPCGHTVACG